MSITLKFNIKLPAECYALHKVIGALANLFTSCQYCCIHAEQQNFKLHVSLLQVSTGFKPLLPSNAYMPGHSYVIYTSSILN